MVDLVNLIPINIIIVFSGRLVLEGPLISEHPYQFEILNISPIAVSSTSNVTFCLKGYGLSQSSARYYMLLLALSPSLSFSLSHIHVCTHTVWELGAMARIWPE